eukprot:CAMPEP_0115661726 /NCGR_PEP_ID=MMETSP0272-20121206/46941_1 /TAXON_ID=71861 /ORGANISM="Scrippsiella trochoidea, Strain CCMP3099" /LENGTH=55 /DNA_ID=CAMNT_0003099987 /DNA_START=193 /DNA_END=356 /DNA_ORIENTATION=+
MHSMQTGSSSVDSSVRSLNSKPRAALSSASSVERSSCPPLSASASARSLRSKLRV